MRQDEREVQSTVQRNESNSKKKTIRADKSAYIEDLASETETATARR